MGATARLRTRAAWEIDLARPRTETERRILSLGRTEIDRLYRLAGLLLGDAADAEDASQEALLRAWRSADSLRDPAGIDAWLDRIVVNICRDRLRRRRTIRFVALADDAGGAAADPFRAVLDRDEALRAMDDLDADQRIVVILHYWSDLTLEAVAERVGWPVGTVKSRLHNALERMRHRIAATTAVTKDAR